MFFRVAFILQREYDIAFDNNFCQETLVFLVLLENFHKQKIYESNPNLVTWIFLFVNMKATGTSQKKKSPLIFVILRQVMRERHTKDNAARFTRHTKWRACSWVELHIVAHMLVIQVWVDMLVSAPLFQ